MLYVSFNVRIYVRDITRGERGHNSQSAESLTGRQITVGGAEKTQQYHKHFLTSERPYVRTWERQMCFLPRAPSNLVTPLIYVPTFTQLLLSNRSAMLLFCNSTTLSLFLCRVRTPVFHLFLRC